MKNRQWETACVCLSIASGVTCVSALLVGMCSNTWIHMWELQTLPVPVNGSQECLTSPAEEICLNKTKLESFMSSAFGLACDYNPYDDMPEDGANIADMDTVNGEADENYIYENTEDLVHPNVNSIISENYNAAASGFEDSEHIKGLHDAYESQTDEYPDRGIGNIEIVTIVCEIKITIYTTAGLWRICVIPDEFDEEEFTEGPPPSIVCTPIDYLEQPWKRVKEQDTSNSILRAMRKSVFAIVASGLVLCVATVCGIAGHIMRNNLTFVSSVVSILGALVLALGILLYATAVQDEVGHVRYPKFEESPFRYQYGWCFILSIVAFLLSTAMAVLNIHIFQIRHIWNFGRRSDSNDRTSTILRNGKATLLNGRDATELSDVQDGPLTVVAV